VISTVTVATSIGDLSELSPAISVAVTLLLLLYLAERELAHAAGARLRHLARNLTVVITPLLVTVGIILTSRLAGAI